ncbi:MAG: sulfatase-like hydrolase/transferase, partial [Pseudomonadota bacterium]
MSDIRNILLLSVEDLNDWITPLGGHPDAVTPNIARLAARGFTFEAAYAASPACSPSRTATLFGQGPWRTGIYGNEQSWAMAYPPRAQLSIAGRARVAGWRTVMAGKVYHTGRSGQAWNDWDVNFPRGAESFEPTSRAVREGHLQPPDDFGPTEAEHLDDDRLVDAMISEMTPGATGQFWAHGIYRPHLPFIAPRCFFEQIPDPPRLPPGFGNRAFDADDESELAPLPRHAQAMARRWTGRMLTETGEHSDFIRAYLASVAYADHLVGRLLDHLDATGLSESTLIVLWSDHGWQFGEKLAFRKFS